MNNIAVITYNKDETTAKASVEVRVYRKFEDAKQYVAKKFAKYWNETGECAHGKFVGNDIIGFTTIDEKSLLQINEKKENNCWSSYVSDCDTYTDIIWDIVDLSEKNTEYKIMFDADPIYLGSQVQTNADQ